MSVPPLDPLQPILDEIYGPEVSGQVLGKLHQLLEEYFTTPAKASPPPGGLSFRDVLLITYPDQFREPGIPPLKTLDKVAGQYLGEVVSGIHILPFYPSSSDEGFAVIDYASVDPRLGSWEDIRRLAGRYRLMVDAVINHISSQSAWFRAFLNGDPAYGRFFITVPPGTDLSMVVRPRALPLLTSFETSQGTELVWTTFSADQIDLNYHNPEVLLAVVDVLLHYVANGAQLIRLDAIAYLWKQIGTPSIHQPQTHAIIRLIRSLMDIAAPQVYLVTETNVPHHENLSYFGGGSGEADLVYNFALPPLVLHTFLTGDTRAINRWAQGISLPSRRVTFFNFLASHDGIGLNPVRGILAPEEIDRLVRTAQQHGGLVSLKTGADGRTTPYELNISLFDALSDPASGEPVDLQVDRFIAAQSIMTAFLGIPGVYVHSLFGSRNWKEGVTLTGQNRSINRQRFDFTRLVATLEDPESLPSRVYNRYASLLRIRTQEPAFDPYGCQRILEFNPAIFALLRLSSQDHRPVLCLANVTPHVQSFHSQSVSLALGKNYCSDLVSGRRFNLHTQSDFFLLPYQTAWLA